MNYGLLVGLIFLVVGIPFYHEKIPPNSIAGVRVPKTYASTETWYAINKIFGQDMIVSGILLILMSLAVWLVSQWYPSLPLNKINVILILICLAGVVAHVFISLNRLSSAP